MKPAVYLASIFVAAGVGAGVALGFVAFPYFMKSNALRLDPAELSVYADKSLPPPTRPRVVIFGDSRAAAWPLPKDERFEWVNRGISSQTTAQLRERFDYDVAPLQPAIVVLQLGVNDLKAAPLFPARRAAILRACTENIAALVVRAEAIGANVVLSTIFSLGEVPMIRRFYMDDDVHGLVAEANRALRSLASARVAILNSQVLDSQERVRPEYRYDFLHLNATGYEALGAPLRASVDMVFSPTTSEPPSPAP